MILLALGKQPLEPWFPAQCWLVVTCQPQPKQERGNMDQSRYCLPLEGSKG
jgi:hypothetical protein